MVLEISMGVFVDMGVVEVDFAIFDTRKRVPDLTFAGTQCLHLGSMKNDPGFEGFQDVVVVTRFGIGQNVGHENFESEQLIPAPSPGRIMKLTARRWRRG